MVSLRIIRRDDPKGSRGFALLIVLWAIVLAALLGSQVTAMGRRETRIALNLRAAAIAEAAADGAVQQAIFHLLRAEQGWAADGTPHELAIGQATIDVTIHDERGKVDLNSASPALLAAFFTVLGVKSGAAEDLAAAIVAWRGGDQNNADIAAWRARYRAAGLDYEPPFKIFETIDELALVLGITPELFTLAEPHITLFGAGGPDARAADPVVRAALQASATTSALTLIAGPATVQVAGVVTIDARALGPDGSAFTRHALVRLGQGTDGYAIYSWTRGSPGT